MTVVTLDQLFVGVSGNSDLIAAGFRSRGIPGGSGLLRVPKIEADFEESALLFNNVELLKKFAALHEHEQRDFLRAVKAYLDNWPHQSRTRFFLAIVWTRAGKMRTIEIRRETRLPRDKVLVFELL